MTFHLGTPWHGTDEPQGIIDQISWALDQWCPGVHKGLTAARTSNNLSVHGDAERQEKKTGNKVILSLPIAAPFPTDS